MYLSNAQNYIQIFKFSENTLINCKFYGKYLYLQIEILYENYN